MLRDFPEYYPEQCPPCDAKDVEGMIFRLTNRNTPNKRDFLSYYELEIATGCQAMGLSVFQSINDCEEFKKKIPAGRKKKIASANLNSNYGKFANTPSTNSERHTTWWVSCNLSEPWTLFSNVG